MSSLLEGVLGLKAIFAQQTWIVSFGVGLVGSGRNYGETKTAQPLPPSASFGLTNRDKAAEVSQSQSQTQISFWDPGLQRILSSPAASPAAFVQEHQRPSTSGHLSAFVEACWWDPPAACVQEHQRPSTSGASFSLCRGLLVRPSRSVWVGPNSPSK